MKEIKAYVRHEKAEEVVHAVEEAGVLWLTAVEVEEMGIDADQERGKYSMEFAEKTCPLVKIEIVCRDDEAQMVIDTLREAAWTSRKGDGIIFVSDIDDAIRIRTGEKGEAALSSGRREEGEGDEK